MLDAGLKQAMVGGVFIPAEIFDQVKSDLGQFNFFLMRFNLTLESMPRCTSSCSRSPLDEKRRCFISTTEKQIRIGVV